MNTSFDSTRSAPATLATRLQQVLAITLSDWRTPMASAAVLDDDEAPRIRRCSLLSRPARRATPLSRH